MSVSNRSHKECEQNPSQTPSSTSNMEEILQSLNGQLGSVRDQLKGRLHEELQASLHNHDKGALPDSRIASVAARSIDLLHQTEQILEPGHLVLADHFLGSSKPLIFCDTNLH